MRRSSWLPWLLLALATTAAIAFAYAARHYYERSVSNRLAPVAVQRGDAAAEVQFIGDSRVERWAAQDTLNAGYTGFPGATSNQILGHYLTTPQALPKSTHVVLQLGINDLRTLGVRPERAGRIVAATCENIKQLVTLLTHHDNRVTLLAIFPTGPVKLTRRWVWSAEIPNAVNLVNTCLTQTSWSENVSLLDTNSALRKLQHTAFVDALHLSVAGYAVVNSIMRNEFQ